MNICIYFRYFHRKTIQSFTLPKQCINNDGRGAQSVFIASQNNSIDFFYGSFLDLLSVFHLFAFAQIGDRIISPKLRIGFFCYKVYLFIHFYTIISQIFQSKNFFELGVSVAEADFEVIQVSDEVTPKMMILLRKPFTEKSR